MNKTNLFVATICMLLLAGCGVTKNAAPTAPPVQRVPAKFDYTSPAGAKVGSTGITIALVKPTYVGKNPEYYVPPFNEMAQSMGNDFEELLTSKGFTVRGPFASRDEMVYNDKVNSNFIMEISIELNPQYNRKPTATSKTNWGALLNSSVSANTTTWKMSGEITLAGTLVLSLKSSQYGELLFKKNIALDPASFTYEGVTVWAGEPTMADELNKDNQVYNTLSRELEKFYTKALDLAWKQIDPAEMKGIAEQGKKADKKGN